MENTTEKELELLLKLQNIDNQIDEIIKFDGICFLLVKTSMPVFQKIHAR